MTDATRTALLVFVELLLSTKDRKDLLFEEALQALLLMVSREKVFPAPSWKHCCRK